MNHALRLTWTVARWLSLGYLVLLGMLMLFEERLIFFPTPGGHVSGPGVDIELRAGDGVRLHARFIERPGAVHTLLYLHGNAGNLAQRGSVLQQLAQSGAHVLALDYRGYGRSEGRPTEAGLYLDARAAYTWASQRLPATGIVLLGESLGGGPACELAVSERIAGLILLSTFTSIPDMAAAVYPWLPLRRIVRTRFDNLGKLPRVAAPKLFIHSRSDEIIPFAMGERLLAAARPPKQALWLADLGHNDTFFAAGPPLLAAIRAFLDDL